MTSSLPSWVAEAARLPLAFAQVREDPCLDLETVEQIGRGARVIMIASGGCTAALLASSGLVAHLRIIDLNPAQLALSRLKLHFAASVEPVERLRLLGHAEMPPVERGAKLSAALQALDMASDALEPLEVIAKHGPDYAGRYELVFANLRVALGPVAKQLGNLLALHDPSEQARRVDPSTALGMALDEALDEVMALPNLVALFGEGATRNRVEPFARHFARRTRWALAHIPAASNPYLWQMYGGAYPEGHAAPWFSARGSRQQPQISWACQAMDVALGNAREEFDFCHLSNILDWLSPDEARATLEVARSALRPGGSVLIRQLNSTLEIPSLGPGFSWRTAESQAMHVRDRSFFYRHIHLGRKR